MQQLSTYVTLYNYSISLNVEQLVMCIFSARRKMQAACCVRCAVFITSLRCTILLHTKTLFQSNLGKVASQPLTVGNNYATKSSLVTVGCSTFAPKYALPFDDFHPHTIHPSLNQPHSPPKRHPDPISHFSTIYPPDRPTDKPTDGPGDKPVPTPAYALFII